jgi:tRNA A-37 threonylcarbamoyl transferase component Bud32/tetratricopeptide (TPR) repeat protein
LLPQRIGKYEVVGKLGQGAMGEVFRAHDPVLNRAVAVKRISAGLDADEMVRKRFQREAQSAALLSHPNIITVYELGFEGDQLFMAMELLDGIDLKHALTARQMTLDEKVGVVQQICEGLAFAHSHDIVHRDLKPANIHILPSGRVKIMDFGLARLSGSEMTTTGMVMGTPHYMSPEQVKGQKADARSDIFALGCLFYELLAGRKPFDAESMHGVLYKIMQEEPTPLREAAPGTPEALAHVVEKALAKNPDERFPSAGDLLVALRHARSVALAGRGPERPPDPERHAASAARPAQRRAAGEPSRSTSKGSLPAVSPDRSRRALLVGLVLAVLALVGGALWLRGPAPDRPPSAPSPSAAADSLTRQAVDSQVELARRRLDAGSVQDAAREAESALSLDPQSAAARQVLEEARAALKAIDDAAAAVRSATASNDRERMAAAAFDLMTLAPTHPDAEQAAAAAGPIFRPRAEEARRLEQEARRSAEQKGSGQTAAFAQAAQLEQRGEQSLRAGQPVAAAQRFLEARRDFERAARPRR